MFLRSLFSMNFEYLGMSKFSVFLSLNFDWLNKFSSSIYQNLRYLISTNFRAILRVLIFAHDQIQFNFWVLIFAHKAFNFHKIALSGTIFHDFELFYNFGGILKIFSINFAHLNTVHKDMFIKHRAKCYTLKNDFFTFLSITW